MNEADDIAVDSKRYDLSTNSSMYSSGVRLCSISPSASVGLHLFAHYVRMFNKGTLITPPIVNRLITTYDWRISYIMLGIIILVIVVLVAQLLKRAPIQMGQRPYDKSGADEATSKLRTGGFSLKAAIYTGQFWMLLGMNFCIGFSAYLILVHIAPHAIELGISSTIAANILATVGGLSIVGRVTMGNVADRIRSRNAFIIGFILITLALFWLAQAKEVWILYLLAGIFGFAWGIGPAISPITAEFFGLSSHGLILGAITLGCSIGGAFGPVFAGYIFDMTESYSLAFLVTATIGIVGLILTMILTSIKGERL